MKLIQRFLTVLALIALSTSSSADQLQSDLNTCTVERERLEEKVVTLESEIKGLTRKNEGLNLDLTNSRNIDQDLQTCQREPNQTLHNFQKCQKELAAEINRSESEKRIISIALETCQKTLDEASSTTQASISRRTTTQAPTPTRAPRPCGSLLSLNTNDPNDPSTPGFVGGTFFDGSKMFVGVGNLAESGCKYTFGGSVLTSSSTYAKGLYSPCHGAKLAYDRTQAKYFYDHQDLHWVLVKNSNAKTMPGGIAVASNNLFDTRIVRMNMTYNGQYVQSIGHFWNNGHSYFWNGRTQINVNANVEYEVLVCDPTL